VLLHEVLALLFFLLGGVEELTIFSLSAEASFEQELAGLFGLLLMHKGTVLFDALAACIIPAYFSFISLLHFLI
jgi:hypothetical protein